MCERYIIFECLARASPSYSLVALTRTLTLGLNRSVLRSTFFPCGTLLLLRPVACVQTRLADALLKHPSRVLIDDHALARSGIALRCGWIANVLYSIPMWEATFDAAVARRSFFFDRFAFGGWFDRGTRVS